MGRLFCAIVAVLAVSSAAHAAWSPPGVDLTRPRILFRPSGLETIQDRVTREPYRSLVEAMLQRVSLADEIALDDEGIEAHRIKSRAAKNLAFLYAIDRTMVDGEVVAFPSAAAREAVGDRVRDWLVNLYPRSRLAVPEPLGGWDRDISTSEELLQYATAYDTMLGAGYDFGADGSVIEERLADLASELYLNYVLPISASSFSNIHNNNHRSKSGASLVVAGIVLAEYVAAADPRGIRDPADWIEYGLDQADMMQRITLVTGDGAYSEGPFYFRFASQNLLPWARAWDRLVGDEPYEAFGLPIPNYWRHPLFRRSLRWMLDMTLPDGSLVPMDDGNPGRSFYFGALPPDDELASAFAWRWQNAPALFETDGNVDLAADAIVAYDDSVVSAPPTGSTTAFYIEGGNAVFRSDWSQDAVVAVVQAEHDTASLFGRDRDGRGVGPQGHEHAEPGSYLLHAFGERLILDPGYLSFGERDKVARPEHHNIVLVDGKGPIDYVDATIAWRRRTGRPPIDGNAQMSDVFDAGFVDGATVSAQYGDPETPVERRFLFVDDGYLLIADEVGGDDGSTDEFTWPIHGNGGGNSGGFFESTPYGGRWTQGAARVDVAFVAIGTAPRMEVASSIHEGAYREELTHDVLRLTVDGPTADVLQLVYPSRAADPPPEITVGVNGDDTFIDLRDEAQRRSLRVWFARVPVDSPRRTWVTLNQAQIGGPRRLFFSELTSGFSGSGSPTVRNRADLQGRIGVRARVDDAEFIVDTGDTSALIGNLPFEVRSADGVCGLMPEGDEYRVRLNRERRFRLKAADENGIPAADAGRAQRVAVGQVAILDGSSSCDPDGDALTPRWRIQSAPAGSSWRLDTADGWSPRLHVDRPGPYRVELVVTDAQGGSSLPVEALVVGGDLCLDGVDNDADGLFDSDDLDCDAFTVCAGDCDDDGRVLVDELLRGVRLALEAGVQLPPPCRSFDRNGDWQVTVDELVSAVDVVLRGCRYSSRG